MRVFYLDTSAAMKLLRKEKETDALVQWKRAISPDAQPFVSSDLLRTELMLSGTRYGVEAKDIRRLVQALSLLRVTSALCESAGRLSGMGLRSVDALHLATALSLQDSLVAIVTYDNRLAHAAESLGIEVESPGG